MAEKRHNSVKDIVPKDSSLSDLVTPEEIQEETLQRQIAKTQYLDWSEIPNLEDPQSIYSAEQKIQGLTAFVVTGSYSKAAKATGLSAACLRNWGNRSAWWELALAKIRNQFNDELDARTTLIMQKVLDRIEDRIVNGDEVILAGGIKDKKQLSGKDLTSILATLYDKRALMREEPTSISEGTGISSQSVLKDLSKAFTSLSTSIQEKAVTERLKQAEKVIEHETE